MDPVLSHHTFQERQHAAVPELPNNKPHQSLGSVITDEGSKPEILSRIAQAIAALTRLKAV